MKKKFSCIIIGLGSMGNKYISIAKKLNLNILGIYDKNQKKTFEALKNNILKKNVLFNNLNKLLTSKPDLAIIATTADSHYEMIKNCAKFNIKKIMVEKPLTNSLPKCKAIEELSKTKRIKICVNHSYRFSNQYNFLKKILKLKKFGNIVSINLIGGNQGISMNGVHFFDILKFLTQSKAVKVFSNVKIDRNINPRGKKFKDYEGQVSIINKNGTRGYIDLSSKAGHGETLTCVCKYGVILIDLYTGRMTINYRKEKFRKFSTVYYGKPFISQNMRIKISDTSEITMLNLDKFLKNKDYVKLSESIEITKILISTIEASFKKKWININTLRSNKNFDWA